MSAKHFEMLLWQINRSVPPWVKKEQTIDDFAGSFPVRRGYVRLGMKLEALGGSECTAVYSI